MLELKDLDPAKPFPGNPKSLNVCVEDMGSLSFSEPVESLHSLGGQVIAVFANATYVGSSLQWEVVAWNPEENEVTLKYNG